VTIYLDHNATSPASQSHWDAVRDLVTGKSSGPKGGAANPSSPHGNGRHASSIIAAARAALAQTLGIPGGEIVFVASATEANNTIVSTTGRGHVIAGATEHPSVLEPVRSFAQSISYVPPVVDDLKFAASVVAAIRPDTTLCAIMSGNNETGQCFPVKLIGDFLHFSRFGARPTSVIVNRSECTANWEDIAATLRSKLDPSIDGNALKKLHFHVDATQTFGKTPPSEWTSPGMDSLAVSGHKIGALTGSGALVIRRGRPLVPLLRGGGQERFRRAGTENVAAIASLGLRSQEIAAPEHWERIQGLRARATAFEGALKSMQNLNVLSNAAMGLPNTVHAIVTGDGMSSEDVLIQLDMAGIAASSGSACSSGTNRPSSVIQAVLALADSRLEQGALAQKSLEHAARNGLRFSLGIETTAEDLQATQKQLEDIIKRLAKGSC
jgi:cysteine desulfurase